MRVFLRGNRLYRIRHFGDDQRGTSGARTEAGARSHISARAARPSTLSGNGLSRPKEAAPRRSEEERATEGSPESAAEEK